MPMALPAQLFAHAIVTFKCGVVDGWKVFVYFVWQFCPVPIKRLNRNYEQKAITAIYICYFSVCAPLPFLSLFFHSRSLCCHSPLSTCQRVKASARRLTASTCFSETRLSSWLFIATGKSYDLTDAIRLSFSHMAYLDLEKFSIFHAATKMLSQILWKLNRRIRLTFEFKMSFFWSFF